MYIPMLQKDILDKFSCLNSYLIELNQCISIFDKNYPAWLLPPKIMKFETSDHRIIASKFFQQIEFLNVQKPKEILIAPGIFACSKKTYNLIHKINEAKDNFKEAIIKFKKENLKIADADFTEQFEKLLKERPSSVATNLKKMGLARLHLKQCYRKIPILNSRPKKVSWTWANTRSIKKIDIETARKMLLKHKQDEGILHQLNKLSMLDPSEKLAIVQELAPHLRANIVTTSADETNRFMLKGTVPIFYLNEECLPLPAYHPPSEKKGKDTNRQVRNDIKLDPVPFLPAIRAHKYLSVLETEDI